MATSEMALGTMSLGTQNKPRNSKAEVAKTQWNESLLMVSEESVHLTYISQLGNKLLGFANRRPPNQPSLSLPGPSPRLSFHHFTEHPSDAAVRPAPFVEKSEDVAHREVSTHVAVARLEEVQRNDGAQTQAEGHHEEHHRS